MSDDRQEFIIEVTELLERAEQALLSLDQNPTHNTRAMYDEVFRSYHNIKGTAGMMEWDQLQQHVHQLENELMKYKETALIPKDLIGWFLQGNDATRSILSDVKPDFNYATPAPATSSAPAADLVAEVCEAMDRVSANLLLLEKDPALHELVDSIYRDIHSAKGAVQLFNLELPAKLSHAMEQSLEGVRAGRVQIDKALTGTLLSCIDLMQMVVKKPGDKNQATEVSFLITMLNSLDAAPASPVVAEALVAPAVAAPEAQLPPQPIVVPTTAVAAAADPGDKADSTIRVQVSLLDRLMTLMGEMVLVRNQVLQYSQKIEDLEFLNLSQKFDVVTTELQEETMKMRMQPIGTVLTKFQRVVRDLSGSLGKKINLTLSGVETELDKSLIEAVKDPLTHIVRNSCDHGCETIADRTSAGKPETSNIAIKAYHEGGQVIIEVADDGRGLHREKLLKKALEKGIVTAEKAKAMSDRDVQALIFAPGFSTAEKVTNVSGRGVGMDVVKSNIEKIGGLVEISSQQGVGTKITLKIPLTLAIVPAMIIRSGDDRYAIPQVKLVELVRVERNEIEMLQGKPVLRLRGQILPLVNLTEVFAIESAQNSNEAINIVVLNAENAFFGLIVDEVIDTADIVVKPLANFLKPIGLYSGATVLGDGSVAFILDVIGIAQKSLGSFTQRVQETSAVLGKENAELGFRSRDYIMVRLDAKTKHAVPLSQVSRMEEFKASEIEESGDLKVVRYRGQLLRLISLNQVLGYSADDQLTDVNQIIVVKSQDQLVGFRVNEIIDVLSTSDHLDTRTKDSPYFAGNLITRDEVVIVLDVNHIVSHSDKKVQDPGLNKAALSRNSFRILVVDDTESVRRRVSQILNESGYISEVVSGGSEGIMKLMAGGATFDLVISDIEMPDMNGYEFAQNVRRQPSLKKLPMIAFTTKNSEEDLKKAQDVGFDAYIEKAKSDLLVGQIDELLQQTEKRTA